MQRTQKIKHTMRRTSGAEIQTIFWQTALWGLLIAWIVTAAGILATSGIFYAGWLGGSGGEYQAAAYTVIAISLLAGMLFTLRRTKGKDRLWVLLVAAGYFIIRLILSAILTFL